MQQIKNYFSQISRMDRVLVLAASPEFEELAKWLLETGKAGEILYEWVDGLSSDGKNTITVDALVFDYGCGEYCITMQGMEPRLNVRAGQDTKQGQDVGLKHVMKPGSSHALAFKHVIGRMRSCEDYFRLWESYRKTASSIYIERDKGLQEGQITPDRPPCEVLFWEKDTEDIELSVIIPVYNVAPYLPKCVCTLTAWKAEYVEFLFVDDGSTDGSGKVVSKFAEKDRRIRLIGKGNGGCASARNAGIREARGRYLGFVDGDDFIDQAMFRKLLSRAMMGNYDLAYCGYQEYRGGSLENVESAESVPVLNDDLGLFWQEGCYRPDKVRLLTVRTRVAIWRCIYRKEVLDRHQIQFHEDLKRYDDLPFRVEFLFAARSAVCIPEYLYYYRLGREGQDVACTDRRLFVHFAIFDHLDEYVDACMDRQLQDLLQIIKIQTHGFGLSKIEKQYRKEYLAMARKQLDRNMGYFRTVGLILMYTGKGNLGWYTRVKLFK